MNYLLIDKMLDNDLTFQDKAVGMVDRKQTQLVEPYGSLDFMMILTLPLLF